MSAMPVMIVVLCVLAIAYRYYSAFLAARVLTLSADNVTPAVRLNDGKNFHPTSKWVLFGHHFAAISGAGPLIGPVLAAQFGYLPGLIWIVVGVCLAGAVQDFLTLGMSIRHGGMSLAQIAYARLGKTAGTAATIAILVILVVAIAGLGKVVVKALGGDQVSLPTNSMLDYHGGEPQRDSAGRYLLSVGSKISWADGATIVDTPFVIATPSPLLPMEHSAWAVGFEPYAIPAGSVRLVPGSSWGTFTIACTIPIALLVGLYMYRIRPGHTVEASIIGGVLTLLATVLGGYVSHSGSAHLFEFSASELTWAMAAYGFIAAVLPVWVLLCPRDYLSSFLKIGTIGVLIVGVLLANPKLEAPAFNHVFLTGGPIVKGQIFPFLFITVMCGAISGFHALVSSGTTSKMLSSESHARTIGYGAMLVEGIVAVVAMIAAASLPTGDYYAMNTELAAVPAFHDRIVQVGGAGGIEHIADYESLTQESLRGRTGGAVTLAVGMAHIFDKVARTFTSSPWVSAMWKYWYHFAIMFEALFILTTIDTGTRIGRFLLQEVGGKIHPRLGLQGGWLAAIVSTAIIVLAWVYVLGSGSFSTIWALFGIANQLLAVLALAVLSAYLAHIGKARYLWVTLLPLTFVLITTSTAAVGMFVTQVNSISVQLTNTGWSGDNAKLINAMIQAVLTLSMFSCAVVVLLATASRIIWRQSDPSSGAQTPA